MFAQIKVENNKASSNVLMLCVFLNVSHEIEKSNEVRNFRPIPMESDTQCVCIYILIHCFWKISWLHDIMYKSKNMGPNIGGNSRCAKLMTVERMETYRYFYAPISRYRDIELCRISYGIIPQLGIDIAAIEIIQ